MASIINASTSGAGGVITTADASGLLNIQTASTTALSVTAAQDTYLGATDTSGTGGQLDKLRVVGMSGPNSSIAQFRFTNDSGGPNLRHYKSRGASVGTLTAVQNTDTLSSWQTYATDGTSWINSVQIGTYVDGAVSTGIIPTALTFATTNSAGGQSSQVQIRANGNFEFNSGYGGMAVAYGCRAWVNFNGTGTVAIRASGNVSSITDNGAGNYTVNFTTAMPDANYSISGAAKLDSSGSFNNFSVVNYARTTTDPTTSNFVISTVVNGGTYTDFPIVNVQVFR